MKANCYHTGEITNMSAHGTGGTHTSITVAHGKRANPPKRGKGGIFPSSYDDRPSSSLIVPNDHAKGLSLGQRVNVGITPSRSNPDSKFAKTRRRIGSYASSPDFDGDEG